MSILKSSILPQLDKTAAEIYPLYFSDYEKDINACCLAICYETIHTLHSLKKDNTFTFRELIEKNNIPERGYYILRQILFILTEELVLILDNEVYTVNKIIDNMSPAEHLAVLIRKIPQEGAMFQWLARAYGGMLDILTGEVHAEDILFPWGNFDLVEEVYFNSNIYSFFPKMTGMAVKLLLEQYYQNNISILEIGAGTGNGTDCVLEHTKGRCSSYVYTDIMRSLLKKAKKKYASIEYISCQLLDLNQDPVQQDLTDNSFDLIIAVNVIHATNDCRRSLQYLYKQLKNNGCLLLTEICPPENSIYRFLELTFGLLPSYSGYEDKDLRPSTPVMRPAKWAELFEATGFQNVIFSPSHPENVFDRGGVIIGIK